MSLDHENVYRNAIPRVTLGKLGLDISKIALGTAGWPNHLPFEEALAILQKAFDAGINMVDTSPLYRSELVLGELLRHADAPDDLVVVTKFSGTWDPDTGRREKPWAPEDARSSVIRSMERLGRDHLDIVHFHDAGPQHLDYVFGQGGAIDAMVAMREEGIIGGIGLATYHPLCHLRALNDGRVDAVQMYHTYTLLNRVAEDEVFPLAQEKGVPIFNAGPYAGYILATGAIPNAQYSYQDATPPVIAVVRQLERLCADKGVTIAQAAMAFSLRDPRIATTVVAASKPEFIDDWVTSVHLPLTDADIEEMLSVVGPSIEPLWLQVSRQRQRDLIAQFGDDWFNHIEAKDHRATKV